MSLHETSRLDLRRQSTIDRTKWLAADRRRPGRPDSVSPTLIPLFRGVPQPGLSSSDDMDLPGDQDSMRATLGVAASVALCMPLWAIIAFIGWAIIG